MNVVLRGVSVDSIEVPLDPEFVAQIVVQTAKIATAEVAGEIFGRGKSLVSKFIPF